MNKWRFAGHREAAGARRGCFRAPLYLLMWLYVHCGRNPLPDGVQQRGVNLILLLAG